MQPLKIHFSDAELARIKTKVSAYEWHEMPEVALGGRSLGLRHRYGVFTRALRLLGR